MLTSMLNFKLILYVLSWIWPQTQSYTFFLCGHLASIISSFLIPKQPQATVCSRCSAPRFMLTDNHANWPILPSLKELLQNPSPHLLSSPCLTTSLSHLCSLLLSWVQLFSLWSVQEQEWWTVPQRHLSHLSTQRGRSLPCTDKRATIWPKVLPRFVFKKTICYIWKGGVFNSSYWILDVSYIQILLNRIDFQQNVASSIVYYLCCPLLACTMNQWDNKVDNCQAVGLLYSI